ncbi:MAG: hypothetical protein AAGA56_15345 [Myxococcota bacterium]
MDRSVDAATVQAFVRAQTPALDGPVRYFAAGWDKVLFRLGTAYLVRLPRRRVAVPLVETEHRWRPGLDPLPLPTSCPIVAGRPVRAFLTRGRSRGI